MPLVYFKDGKVVTSSPQIAALPTQGPAHTGAGAAQDDIRFLREAGLSAEHGDYREPWRIFRIMAEFVEGYQFLARYHNEVTVFGGARFLPDNHYYKLAQELGGLLARGGYTTITGGGSGIMAAANRGAYEAGGASLGINIELPHEQKVNPYVTDSLTHHYFFTRKVMFATPAQAFVFFPGGYGTNDEFWEIIDLMGDEYLDEAPLILVGGEYWRPMLEWISNNEAHTLSEREKAMLDGCSVVETAQEAFEIIKTTKDVQNVCELAPGSFNCSGREIHWRIFRIMAELVEGFDFLTGLVDDVTVLGTYRCRKGSRFHALAEEFGRVAARAGYSVVSGGKLGIAEAAGMGAIAEGGRSIGLYLERARREGKVSAHLTESMGFHFPFTRKLILTAPSKGFAMFPGGLGTMHQAMEVLTLIETGKIKPVPVVLLGAEYWQPLVDFIRRVMYEKFHTVDEADMDYITITDDPQDAMDTVTRAQNGGV